MEIAKNHSFNAFISSFTDHYSVSDQLSHTASKPMNQVIQSTESLQNVTTTHNAMLYSNSMTRATPPLNRSGSKIQNINNHTSKIENSYNQLENSYSKLQNTINDYKSTNVQSSINRTGLNSMTNTQSASLGMGYPSPAPAPQPKLPPLLTQAPQISIIQRQHTPNSSTNFQKFAQHPNISFDSSAKSTPPQPQSKNIGVARKISSTSSVLTKQPLNTPTKSKPQIISKQPQHLPPPVNLNIPPPPSTQTASELFNLSGSSTDHNNNKFSYKSNLMKKAANEALYGNSKKETIGYGKAMAKLSIAGDQQNEAQHLLKGNAAPVANGYQMASGESYRLL